jgi:hypothetical protein
MASQARDPDAKQWLGSELRPRSEGTRCRRAAEKRDELATSHSITSLARASSVGAVIE